MPTVSSQDLLENFQDCINFSETKKFFEKFKDLHKTFKNLFQKEKRIVHLICNKIILNHPNCVDSNFIGEWANQSRNFFIQRAAIRRQIGH